MNVVLCSTNSCFNICTVSLFVDSFVSSSFNKSLTRAIALREQMELDYIFSLFLLYFYIQIF